MKNTTRKEIVAKTSKLFFFAALLTAFATVGSAQETKKVEKDGFVWYNILVWRNGDPYEGALDANKKTIIPANKYQHISYEEIKDAEFLAKLGSIMEKGEGVTVNTKKAKELYAQTEKAGYAPAGPMLKALNDKENPSLS